MSRAYNHPYRTLCLELPSFDAPAAEHDLDAIAGSYNAAGWRVEQCGDGGLWLRDDAPASEDVVSVEYYVNGQGRITLQTTYYAESTNIVADERTFLFMDDGTLLRDRETRLYEDDHEGVLHDYCAALPPAA